jgi:hypothetical protein
LFKLVERGHAQLPVNLQDLVRAQMSLRMALKRQVRTGAVKRWLAYARNLTEAILRYDLRKRDCEREEAFGGPGIGAGPVWVTAAERGALAEFYQEFGDRRGVKTGQGFSGCDCVFNSTPGRSIGSH